MAYVLTGHALTIPVAFTVSGSFALSLKAWLIASLGSFSIYIATVSIVCSVQSVLLMTFPLV